jgi:outer membrane protein assembly factor BamB
VLATGAKGSLYLFELGEEGLKKVNTYNDLGDYAANAVLAPGEKSVFVGLRTPLGEIIELDLETGKVLWRSPPYKQDKATAERLAFLPDGRLLAMFATGEMTIWKKM